MIDFANIIIKAGNGGDGSGSFMHIGRKHSKADGGNGGRGGDVYMVVSQNLNTLEPFRYMKHYEAKNGQIGASKRRTGASADHLEIKLPLGTNIKVNNEEYDLLENDQKILIGRGGQGGRGNIHLKDEFGRRPRLGEKGEIGEEYEVTLELKLMADVGLIGFPNAGKSTLISTLTSAKPKIANYPFTTLEPNLGVLFVKSKKITIADIPGLIEGASEGRGLGDLFLRHIERTKILAHLIDVSTDSDKLNDYKIIRDELKQYSMELSKKKEVIVLTKCDLVKKEKWEKVLQTFRAKKKKVIAISATEREGLDDLISALVNSLK